MRTTYRQGDWVAICDACGKKAHFSKLMKRWDGAYVHKQCWDARHPQEFVRAPLEKSDVDRVRPESTDYVFVHPVGSIESDLTSTIGSLTFSGDMYHQEPITTNTTLTTEEMVFACGTLTITLPTVPSDGQTITINNVCTGTVTVSGTLTKTEVNYSSAELSPNASITIRWSGTTWDVITESGTIVYVTTVYATWNPADKSAGIVLSNGDLTALLPVSGMDGVRSTISQTSGKWYWEYHVDSMVTTPDAIDFIAFGIATTDAVLTSPIGIDGYGWTYGVQLDTPTDISLKYHSGTTSAYGTIITSGATIGVALDLDDGTIAFYLDNVLQGVAFTDVLGSQIFAAIGCTLGDGDVTAVITANFGASAFTYSVPAGYNSGLYE